MIGDSNTGFQIKKDNLMKKIVMLAVSLSIISSSSLFGSTKGDGPIHNEESMINANVGQKKAKLKEIKKLASRISDKPKSSRNKRRAKKIINLVDALL